MSLLSFHRFLILTAIAFCLGYAAWELRAYFRFDAGASAVLVAGVFVVLGFALTVYLVRLRSILGLKS